MKHTLINHIDCFAGSGGICTGFKAAGLTTLAAVEKVKSCVETYQANHSEIPVIHKDIRMVQDNELRDIVAGRKIDILRDLRKKPSQGAKVPCQ